MPLRSKLKPALVTDAPTILEYLDLKIDFCRYSMTIERLQRMEFYINSTKALGMHSFGLQALHLILLQFFNV